MLESCPLPRREIGDADRTVPWVIVPVQEDLRSSGAISQSVAFFMKSSRRSS